MSFDYAVGQSIVLGERTFIRAVLLTPPCRYFASRDSAGFVTLPTLDPGSSYVELQGIQNFDDGFQDQNNDLRFLGDGGWRDSRRTGQGWQASVTAYFMKDAEIPAGQNCPVFRGGYEEGFRFIEQARRYNRAEIYVEKLVEMGRANGSSGNYIYDYTGVNCDVQNLRVPTNAEGMIMANYDLVGRGEVVTGLYDAGSQPLRFGSLQSGFLFTSPSSGTRRYAVVPADNADSIVVSTDITVTYTTDGSTAMDFLALEEEGGGFRVEVASSGVVVPAAVTLGGVGNNVVTINPTTDLGAATIYRLIVRDGALTQLVDGAGNPNASGVKRSLQGFTTVFKTA